VDPSILSHGFHTQSNISLIDGSDVTFVNDVSFSISPVFKNICDPICGRQKKILMFFRSGV
jgi:hypothetical protein